MYEFVLPAVNYFGSGSINQIKEICRAEKIHKILIVTDQTLVKLGYANQIKKIIEAASAHAIIYDKVQPNPTIENVEEATKMYHEANADAILGLGGGSANDCAKAVAILAANGGSIYEYVGVNMSKQKSMPIICVNTTVGTASEISRAFIISDHASEEKLIFKDIHALPSYSINDVDFMKDLPSSVTAQTGMDALTHAVEAYVSTGKNKFTQIFAKEAIKLIFENLQTASQNNENIEAKEAMIHAEFLAGMAFCNSGVGLVHAMSHPLGAVYDLSHGLCNAILLPYVVAFNRQDAGVAADYAALARSVFPETNKMPEDEQVQYFIDQIITLSQNVGTDIKLTALGVEEDNLESLADKTLKDGNMPRNPIQPTAIEIKEILKEAL